MESVIQAEIKKNPLLNEVINYLSNKEVPSYLFGSAPWRLALKEQDGHDFDIVTQVNKEKFIKHLKEILAKLKYDNVKFVENLQIDGYIESMKNGTCAGQHVEMTATKNGTSAKYDFIFVVDIGTFASNLCDIDAGMLMYDIIDSTFITGGVELIDIQQILESVKEKKLATSYISNKSIRYTRTTFWRLMKYIYDYGFSCDEQKDAELILRSLKKSFCINVNENTPKHMKMFFEKYTDIKSEGYLLAKRCFDKLMKKENDLTEVMVSYALYVRDFEYALSILKFFTKTCSSQHKIIGNYIAIILRKNYTDDECKTFIETFNKNFALPSDVSKVFGGEFVLYKRNPELIKLFNYKINEYDIRKRLNFETDILACLENGYITDEVFDKYICEKAFIECYLVNHYNLKLWERIEKVKMNTNQTFVEFLQDAYNNCVYNLIHSGRVRKQNVKYIRLFLQRYQLFDKVAFQFSYETFNYEKRVELIANILCFSTYETDTPITFFECARKFAKSFDHGELEISYLKTIINRLKDHFGDTEKYRFRSKALKDAFADLKTRYGVKACRFLESFC